MSTKHLLILIMALTSSCRTQRAVVEVMETNAPSNPPSDDYVHVEGSIKTTFAISGLSLPTQKRNYDRVDLALTVPGTTEELYSWKNYQPGEANPIKPHRDYDIILNAYAADKELYSTRFCSQRQTFRAEEGANTFTASLCAKTQSP